MTDITRQLSHRLSISRLFYVVIDSDHDRHNETAVSQFEHRQKYRRTNTAILGNLGQNKYDHLLFAVHTNSPSWS